MNEVLTREITSSRIKLAGLNLRCQSVLAMADLLNDYVQLTAQQSQLIDKLNAEVIKHERNRQPAESDGSAVPSAPSASA